MKIRRTLVLRLPIEIEIGPEEARAAAMDGELLTRAEMAVLEFLIRAMSNKEIAVRMGISESGVKKHVGNLLRKKRCATRGQLIYQERCAAEELGK